MKRLLSASGLSAFPLKTDSNCIILQEELPQKKACDLPILTQSVMQGGKKPLPEEGDNMALAPVTSTTPTTAQNAFGLDFQSLLQIILTQLTYQDPLKPMDNFQFVSQLGQFSQLQQGQILNDQVTNLLSAQGALQATSLLGRTVDIVSNGTTNITGKVKAVSFASGSPTITIETTTGSTLTGISIADVVNIRE